MFRFILINKRLGRYILQQDPVGWDSSVYTFKRSKQYHGITIEYSHELEFVKDGKDYIQAVYEQEGIEGQVDIVVQERDINLYWHTAFVGVINFTKYEVTETRVKTNIEQTGFARRFLNSDDIEINLAALESPVGEALQPFAQESINLPLHSKTIAKQYEAKISKVQGTTESLRFANDAAARTATIIIGWDDVIKNELKAYTYGTGFSFEDNVFELFETVEAGPFTVSIRFKALVEALRLSGDFDFAELKFFFRRNLEKPVQLYKHTDSAVGGTYAQTPDISFDTVVNIKAGDKLYFWGTINLENVSALGYEFQYRITPDPAVCHIKIDALTQTTPSNTTGMMVHETAARLVQAMTGKHDSMYSTFFGRTDSQPRKYTQDGEGSLMLLTNGYQIRNFPKGERPVVTTFKKWYDSMDAIYNIGAGIELIEGKERVRIEPKQHFYRDEVVLELGPVADLSKTLAAEHFYNQLETGYLKWQTETDGGLDEFNSKRSYALPLTQIKKKYSALSPYIAGGYAIESIRREQYVLGSTKDNTNDDEVFIVCVLRNGSSFITERNQAFEYINNVLGSDTVYNARISPARMLARHASVLKAALLHQLDKHIKFTAGDGNYKMASKAISEAQVLVENQDFLVAALPNPFFLPEYYSFKCELDTHQIKLVKENPYGLIKFKDSLFNDKFGYLVELKASTLEPSQFKLLRRFE